MATWTWKLNGGLFRRAAFLRVILIPALIASVTAMALGQSAARPDKGVRPAGSYAVSDIENVNMTNGSVNLSIPLASLPPIAGGKLSWAISANYNSKMWETYQIEEEDNSELPPIRWMTSHVQPSAVKPWFIGGSYRIEVVESRTDVAWRDPLFGDPDYAVMQQHSSWYKVTLTMPDGAVHELRPRDGEGEYPTLYREYLNRYSWKTPKTANPPTTMTYYSYDGSYLWAAIQSFTGPTPLNWDVYLPDGTRIMNRDDGNQYIIDTNGNSIRIYGTTTGMETATHFVDQQTLREIRYVDSFPQPRVEYQTVEGIWRSILINLRSTTVDGWAYYVNNDPMCSERAELIFNQDITVLDSIVLPQTEPNITRQFEFEYNSDTSYLTDYEYRDEFCLVNDIDSISGGLGSLSKMKTPSGAEVSYGYTLDIPPPPPKTPALAGVLSAVDFPGDKIKTKQLVHDTVTDSWNYNIGFSGSRVDSLFDGSFVIENHYPHNPAYQFTHGGTNGRGGLAYSTNQSDRVFIERKWKLNSLNGMPAGSTGSGQLVPFNPVVEIEFTTLMDPPGTKVKMSAEQFAHDLNGNVVSETDYDWFNPNDPDLMRDPETGVPAQVPASASKLRVITNSYHNDATDQNSLNIYHNRVNGDPPTPLILNALKESTIGQPDPNNPNIIVILAKSHLHYDGHNLDSEFDTVPTVGNVTKERRDKNGTGAWIDTIHTYGPFGNRATTTDPRNNITQLFYEDNSPSTHAQPTRIVLDPNPDPGVTGDELTTRFTYDFATGLITSQKDPNNRETLTNYDNQLLSTPTNLVKDPFLRRGKITDPVGRTVVTLYHDNARKIETKADLRTNDGLLRSITTHDNLGRVVKVEGTEYTSAYTLMTDTVYEKMGRVTYTSNPHRSGTLPSDGWTRTKTDDIGRVIEVATFDGATKPTEAAITWNGQMQTFYNAEQTTVIDQANKQRKSVVDGLGRLIRVFEDPAGSNFQTDYKYDALGNLLQVDQGTQHRFFTYDGLSRLLTAKNPEQVSGATQIATTYDYDAASNLISKTGPNTNTSVSFAYDGLNRVKTKTLTQPGSSTIWDYAYDSPGTLSNGKGRLTSVILHDSTDGYYYDNYDAMGRVKQSRQITTAGTANSYLMSYEYNLAGGMTQQTYPSGKVFVTEYDDAGRIAGVKRGTSYYAGGAPTDATNRIQYAPHGATGAVKLGNGKWEHTMFNARLQPTEIGLGANSAASDLLKLEHTYNTPGQANNNGNVRTQTITAPKSQPGTGNLVLAQNYSYDALNRLSVVEELIGAGSQWNQTYDIDRWGNRAVRNTPTAYIPSPLLTPLSANSTDFSAFNQPTNRLAMSGFVYDTSGNLTKDPNTPTNGIVYDAENHQTSYTKTGPGGGTTSYSYDGDGHRVKKTDPNNNTTIFVYNVAGQLIAEYTSDPVPQPQGGGGTSYLTSDHLGSTRVVTSAADGGGNITVKARYDYLPFGEEIDTNHGSRSLVTGYGASDGTRQKFTQKERDNESGLDYFGARYYSSAQGRFTSVDPITIKRARLIDPQRLNLYVYGRCNPLKYVDPNGADIMLAKDLNQKGHEKDRKYVVENLARLYMTAKGKAYLERADKSPFDVEVGKGTLPRQRLGAAASPGTTTFGGSEHVTAGITTTNTTPDPTTGKTLLVASGPEIMKGGKADPITITIDKDNAADMGKDPAKVFAHEFGGHLANVLNLAERPDPNNPANPSFDVTGRDSKKEEEDSRKAEDVGKLPGKASPEAIQAVENLLKKRP